MVGATKTATRADRTRMEMIRGIGCIACAVEGWPGVACEVDHLLIGGERHEDEHRYTIGLCSYHHRGVVPESCRGSIAEAAARFGPNKRHASKAFHERYGSDEQLLLIQDAAIRIVERDARKGKYFPPRMLALLIWELHKEIVR